LLSTLLQSVIYCEYKLLTVVLSDESNFKFT
jgi:hypothetical protein